MLLRCLIADRRARAAAERSRCTPELPEALIALQTARPDKARGYSAAAITIWFHTRYRELRIEGLVAQRTAHRLKDADIVDHLVELVEKKAAEIEATKESEQPAGLSLPAP
jgi:hypothetical protein